MHDLAVLTFEISTKTDINRSTLSVDRLGIYTTSCTKGDIIVHRLTKQKIRVHFPLYHGDAGSEVAVHGICSAEHRRTIFWRNKVREHSEHLCHFLKNNLRCETGNSSSVTLINQHGMRSHHCLCLFQFKRKLHTRYFQLSKQTSVQNPTYFYNVYMFTVVLVCSVKHIDNETAQRTDARN